MTYSYDVHGNIKTKTQTPINPKTGQVLKQSNNHLMAYQKSIQFTYNANNELKQTITIQDTGLEVTKTTTNYFYDAFGRRIAKSSKIERLNKLNQKGALVRYPTTLRHLRKTDKTTHQTTLMLWEGNRQIQEYIDQFIFTTVYDQDSFEPVSRLVQDRQDTSQIKVYHYHNNHLGTPQELTDDDGNIIWANYEYAWGGRYTHHYTSQSLNGCAILEHELQPIRFQGQFFDQETSLHYNRFRYYDSDVGMFIQRDPIGLLGGNNVFQYAPNPIQFIDPFGLSCNRQSTVGDTPSITDQTGKIVMLRMLANGELKGVSKKDILSWKSRADIPNRARYQDANNPTIFHRINRAHMGHTTDAVTYWNTRGKYFGKKSHEVRSWMLDPDNYRLQPPSDNCSTGAKLNQTYDMKPATGPAPKAKYDNTARKARRALYRHYSK